MASLSKEVIYSSVFCKGKEDKCKEVAITRIEGEWGEEITPL